MAGIQVLTVAFWPVLPVWLAAQRVRALVEMACDEAALDAADAGERRRYGHTLLDMAEWRSVMLAPLGAGELHFGSTLRARVEALANVRRWPLVVQVGARPRWRWWGSPRARPSVPGRARRQTPGRRDAQGQTLSPPPAGVIRGGAELLQYCGAVVESETTGNGAMVARYRTSPVDVPPPNRSRFCPQPRRAGFREGKRLGRRRARRTGEIAKDIAAAYEKSVAAGKAELCPSGPPVPKTLPGRRYAVQDDVRGGLTDRAGWSCLMFCMDAPMWFQYELVSDGQSFHATAHAQRTNFAGQLVDVTMVLRGALDPRTHDFNIATNLEETWKVMP